MIVWYPWRPTDGRSHPASLPAAPEGDVILVVTGAAVHAKLPNGQRRRALTGEHVTVSAASAVALLASGVCMRPDDPAHVAAVERERQRQRDAHEAQKANQQAASRLLWR